MTTILVDVTANLISEEGRSWAPVWNSQPLGNVLRNNFNFTNIVKALDKCSL